MVVVSLWVHVARDGAGAAADGLKVEARPRGRRHRRVADPSAVHAAGTDRLDNVDTRRRPRAPELILGGPPPCWGRGVRAGPSCPSAEWPGWRSTSTHARRRGRPDGRHPHLQRAGSPSLLVDRRPPVADAWGVTYEVLCVDDGSSDPPRCCSSGSCGSGSRCGSCVCVRTPGTRRRSRLGWRGLGGVGRHDRRRPAGPARGHRRDARRRAGSGRRRRLRGARGPFHRHGVQAGDGGPVLPVHPRVVRTSTRRSVPGTSA